MRSTLRAGKHCRSGLPLSVGLHLDCARTLPRPVSVLNICLSLYRFEFKWSAKQLNRPRRCCILLRAVNTVPKGQPTTICFFPFGTFAERKQEVPDASTKFLCSQFLAVLTCSWTGSYCMH